MEENVKEEMTNQIESESQDVDETIGKKSSKNKFIIIGGVALVAVIAVVLFFVLGGVGKGKIKIDGKTYSYSAENGIDGIEDIADGVVVMSGMDTYLCIDGKKEEVSGDDVRKGKYPVVYVGTRTLMSDNGFAISEFMIYGDYETYDGATWDSNTSDLEKKGYLCVGNTSYMVTTANGSIDWDDIEKDYEKIVSSDSFYSIGYMDGALAVAPDALKPGVYNDSVQSVIDICNSLYRDGDGKAAMMYWLARGKAMYMLMEGDIDYFVTEGVMCSENEGGPLNLQIFTSNSNAEKIVENLGLK